MKRIAILTLVLIAFIFLLPVMAVREEPLAKLAAESEQDPENAVETAGSSVIEKNKDGHGNSEDDRNTDEDPNADPTSGHGEPEETTVLLGDNDTIVRVKMGKEVKTMTMQDYLLGVMVAEMPASFPIEALRAQAVAARTFTYSRIAAAKEGNPSHQDADVCTESGHCKAYIDWREIKTEWETLSKQKYIEKIEDAVQSTNGEVILYEGEPIVAVFHAASGAYTESAQDVWGTYVPYLQSVESPDGDEYTKKVTISADEFRDKFLAKYPDATFEGSPKGWIQNIVSSDAGGVIRITIGGVEVSGKTVRALYGLASANFVVDAGKDKVTFQSNGYGHCVGMSQYGARALALKGYNYYDILSWYYTDIDIKRMTA